MEKLYKKWGRTKYGLAPDYLFFVIMITLSLSMVGCGSGGSDGEGNGPDEDITFPRPPNPLTVDVQLNSANSAQALISSAGGSIELTLTNETKVILEIPESALLSSVEIKITEVESIDGIPFAAGYDSSVHFEPEGLRLLKPAILKMFPPGDLPALTLTGFSFHALGEEFHLYPLETLSDSVQFELIHFSGYGSGNATGQENADQRENHPPTSDEDQANQESDPNNSPKKNLAMMLAWWTNVDAMISLAESSETHLNDAYIGYLSWSYALLKDPISLAELQNLKVSAEQRLGSALYNAIQASYDRCVSTVNVNEVAKILRWHLWSLSKPEISAFIPDLGYIEMLVKTCAKFELEFKSLIIENFDASSNKITTEIEAIVPIELSSSVSEVNTLRLTGETPSRYLQAEAVFDPDCDWTFDGIDGNTFRVTRFDIDLNYIIDPVTSVPPWLASDVIMWIDHGSPGEFLNLSCPPAPPVNTGLNIWSGGWGMLHNDELDQVHGNGFKIKYWDTGTGSIFAEKSYQRDDSTGVFRETSTLKLKHTPW